MSTYSGLNKQSGQFGLDGMVTDDLDGTVKNYRNWHIMIRQRTYREHMDLNYARDITNDLIALPGVKDEGRFEFIDDWFGVFPKRRRPRRLYADQITQPNIGL